MNKRPLSVTVISLLFIVVCVLGLATHLNDFFKAHKSIDQQIVWVLCIRCFAVVCGLFMLRASNWARWGLLMWLVYHVILSVFHSATEVLIHALLLVVIAYFLLRPEAAAYFRGVKTLPSPEET